MISSKVEVTILDTLRYSCYWYPFSRHIKNICSMASTIPIKSSVDERASSVHFLPCSINHDGPALVNSFFNISPERSNGTHKSHFRGHQLIGKQVDLSSDDVVGVCISKNSDGLEMADHFGTLHAWEHDIPPNDADLKSYMDWFDIADSIHNTFKEEPLTDLATSK